MPGIGDDDRAVSETAGVAVLVGLMLVTTVSVGLSVVIFADEDSSGFDVRFQYSSDLSQVTLFYEGDDEVQAGNVVVDGPTTNVTWAELADVEPGETIAPGGRPVFLNDASAYENDVEGDDAIRVVFIPDDGESVVQSWNEQSDDDGGTDDGGTDDGFGDDGPEAAIGPLTP